MIKHNFHSHTTYCNHSIYSPEELIQRAIKAGLETMGITEHIDLPSQDGKFRLKDNEALMNYIEDVNKLKEKYKDQIRVLCALETEIIDEKTGNDLSEWIEQHARLEGVDYIILGHHSYHTGKHSFYEMPNEEELRVYVEAFKKAVDNKNILYIAHPDGFLKGAKMWTPELLAASREMIQYAKDHGKALGLNVNGFSYGIDFCYPNQTYFDMVGEIGADVVVELDAHNEQPFQEEAVQKALDIAKKAKLNIIERII